MAMRTYFDLECSCGYKGRVRMKENDAPFSASYESYSLVGFEGGTHYAEPHCSLQEAIEAMKPMCPECGSRVTG